MDLTAITFTELRYVVAVADAGHCGRAATRCHVSQPTLSTQVKKLEPLRRRIGLVSRRSFPDEAGMRALAACVRARAPRVVRAVPAARVDRGVAS